MFNKKDNMTEAERETAKYNAKQEKLDDKIKEIEQKSTFKNRLNKLKFPTYTKNLVALIIAICLIDLQLTYILAFMGKSVIAEELSKQICTTILGVAFVYMVRAYFDTKAEKNNDNSSSTENKLSKELDTLVASKINSVLNEATDGSIDVLNSDDEDS
jgi:hypothetical protein